MKIALLGELGKPISKDSFGGTENWTYNFAESLLKQGHKVTLFAREESQFSGELISICGEQDLTNSNGSILKEKLRLYTIAQLIKLLKMEKDFDVVHLSQYSFYFGLPLCNILIKPLVGTIHGYCQFERHDLGDIIEKFSDFNYAFISEAFLKKWPKPKNYRIIPHGINCDQFPFSGKPDDYYFYMGRVGKEKGTGDAVAFAKKTGSRLIIAGPIDDEIYFKQEIKPNLNEKIQYIGLTDFDKKIQLYKNAKAFLMPINWDEPFGLVVIEAMACGAPVIAYNRGAMSEIIEDGKNGFLVPEGDIEGLVRAADKISVIDRKYCREVVEKKYSIDRMTKDYLEYYEELTKKKSNE